MTFCDSVALLEELGQRWERDEGARLWVAVPMPAQNHKYFDDWARRDSRPPRHGSFAI